MLLAKNVTVKRSHQRLIEHCNFEVNKGETLHITGKNGCGKSTLLSAILNLFPFMGEIANHAYKTHFLGHQLGIKANLTATENLTFMTQVFDGNTPSELAILKTLNTLNLPPQTYAAEYSKGQWQKLALARFWLLHQHDNVLWVLDEPFANLDAETATLLCERLNSHTHLGGSLVLTSHQPYPLNNQKSLAL